MKRTIWLWQLFGFAITSFLGTLLHFLYDWTDKSFLAALFSGVNESTWEHMKLLFWPMLVFAVFQSFFFKGYKSFICVKLSGLLLGLSLIPVLFYTYNGAIGKSADFVNIIIFFVSAALAYAYEAKLLGNPDTRCRFPKIAIMIVCVIGLLFVVFTFKAPHMPIFKDPISETYGIDIQ